LDQPGDDVRLADVRSDNVIQPMLAVVEKKAKKAAADMPKFAIGDTVTVHVRIIEGEKERIQPYSGVVIARRGAGMGETFTVRRIVNNEGVERIFPMHSPKIGKVEVVRSGHVRRAKLYYLRDRVGKSRRLRDRKQNKPTTGAAPATSEG
jgi:large subunit ribosomal protein L19